MTDYKDLAGATRRAIGALWVYMVLNALFSATAFYATVLSPQPEDEGLGLAVGLFAGGFLLALFATLVLVGRWIYRASANAHALSADMTITPGWAVGWYFVPFANLIKPFRAMKETWLASHYRDQDVHERAPPLLNWWWGLWILTNILGNISLRTGTSAPQFSASVDLVDGIINVPLSLILMAIMKQITGAQALAIRQDVFA